MINLNDYGFESYFGTSVPSNQVARVINANRGYYRLIAREGELLARLRGTARPNDSANLPVAGDWVEYLTAGEGAAIVDKILPRKSSVARKVADNRSVAQVIAANVDGLYICLAADKPLNLSLLERCMYAFAPNGQCEKAVLLTKEDLCDTAAHKAEIARTFPGLAVHGISVFRENEVLQQLFAAGKTTVLVGASGVGKSSLINLLSGCDVERVGDVNANTKKGRHTTTGSSLHALMQDYGCVIDTAGMRSVGVSGEGDNIFEDIEQLAAKCKFRDCTHVSEHGCAIRAAIEAGALDERRLKNYQKLNKEARYVSNAVKKRLNARGEAARRYGK